MAVSLIYRSTLCYELVMLGLYGRYYTARYQALTELIPEAASVLDLCCGPAILYDRHLRHKSVDYLGLDLNHRFVERLRKRDGQARVWDLRQPQPLPAADYVIMQASLYHFLPDPGPLLNRMFQAARKQVIIAEPIRNLANSQVPLLAATARLLTNPGDGQAATRFTEQTLDELCKGLACRYPRQTHLICGGREKIYIFRKNEAENDRQISQTTLNSTLSA